jgi:hypothetical protein
MSVEAIHKEDAWKAVEIRDAARGDEMKAVLEAYEVMKAVPVPDDWKDYNAKEEAEKVYKTLVKLWDSGVYDDSINVLASAALAAIVGASPPDKVNSFYYRCAPILALVHAAVNYSHHKTARDWAEDFGW